MSPRLNVNKASRENTEEVANPSSGFETENNSIINNYKFHKNVFLTHTILMSSSTFLDLQHFCETSKSKFVNVNLNLIQVGWSRKESSSWKNPGDQRN